MDRSSHTLEKYTIYLDEGETPNPSLHLIRLNPVVTCFMEGPSFRTGCKSQKVVRRLS